MDPEIQSFFQIWLTAAISLIFCHQVAGRIPSGGARLLSLLPVIYLFSTLPFGITNYIHLGGPTFFYFVWLGNFKLLLFAFNQGPLAAAAAPPNSLLQFVSIGLLPINLKSQKTPINHRSVKRKRLMLFIKLLLLGIILRLYEYRGSLNYYLICFLYCCNVYIGVELTLALTAAPVRALGYELEPQFDEPYLATSLQDFWGRRWNLMVTTILRPTVYFPVRRISTRLLGDRCARPSAIVATFLVSGLMHELIYYYMSRAAPTWEVTWFFLLHGFCVTVEVAVKKVVCRGGWSPPAAVSRLLTIAFMGVTGAWLFFPQLIRNGVDSKAIHEYSMMVDSLMDRIPIVSVK